MTDTNNLIIRDKDLGEPESFVIPKNKKFAKKAKKAGFILSFIIYQLVLFVIFYLVVNVNSIFMAFKDGASFALGKTKWVGFNNFSNYIDSIFKDGALIRIGMGNSIKLYAISLVICMPLYIIFSYLLYKKFFAHKAIRVVVMLPQIISGFIIAMLFSKFVSGDNAPLVKFFFKKGIYAPGTTSSGLDLLFNSSPKVKLGTTIFYAIWLSFGTNLIVYPNAMKEISSEVVESSKLDGVTTMWQDLWHIVLPLIFPTLETFLITGLAAIFSNEWGILTFYFRSAPEEIYNIGYYYTQQVLTANKAAYPLLAAGGLIMTCIVAPLTILLRFLLEKFGPTTEA